MSDARWVELADATGYPDLFGPGKKAQPAANQRIVLVGGPMRSKSTVARREFAHLPQYCTDTAAQQRAPFSPSITFMPEHVTDWSAQSQHVADHWLTMPGPWVIEGVATARALRKWVNERPTGVLPCDRVIVFRHAHPEAEITRAQEAMARGVWTVWQEIESHFRSVVEYR